MKKVLKVLLVITLIMTISVTAISSHEPYEVYTVTVENLEITIEHQGLSQEKLNMIVNESFEPAPTIASYNLACLFGHSLSTGTKIVTSHNVRTTSPKCLKETISFSTCTRSGCDYYSSTVIDSNYVTCH